MRYKILEHLNLMVDPDGFIREQSIKHHQGMTLQFSEICRYYKTSRIENPSVLEQSAAFLRKFS